MKKPHSDYDIPWMVALRKEPGAGLCCEPDCDLSGNRAHVGPCEPCACGMNHAIEECPENRTDGCRACDGRGYHTCLNCKGVGRVQAHPEHVPSGRDLLIVQVPTVLSRIQAQLRRQDEESSAPQSGEEGGDRG